MISFNLHNSAMGVNIIPLLQLRKGECRKVNLPMGAQPVSRRDANSNPHGLPNHPVTAASTI